MKYIWLVLFTLFLVQAIKANILIIPENYSTIQQAVNAASNGDTLIVKPGIYKEKVVIKNKALFITSKFFLAHNKKYITNTILNGEGKYTPVTFLNCPKGTVFSGFSIINGYGKNGGGISAKNSNISLENLYIIQNTAEVKGGGIFLSNSEADIIDSRIEKNSAIGIGAGGGGIFADKSEINGVNLKIKDNLAFLGGGFYALNSKIQLQHVDIIKNNSDSNAGGLYLINCKDGILKNLNIIENSAYKEGGIGGGISLDSSNPIIINCRISKNISHKAAGIYMNFSSPKIVNCIIDNNLAKITGGAMLLYHSEPLLQNVTIIDNSSENVSGISCKSMTKLTIINSILWNNKNTDIVTDFTSEYNISYSIIKGDYFGKYIYTEDPIFVDYKNRDYHLNKTSFGINKGNPQRKYNDKDGSRNDLGAYGGEFGNW